MIILIIYLMEYVNYVPICLMDVFSVIRLLDVLIVIFRIMLRLLVIVSHAVIYLVLVYNVIKHFIVHCVRIIIFGIQLI
jgi:hypothetical protein